eukprot:gb/GECG01014441.1/.p1 GENE.gb/GECG01014441.1/~~gb/GECG01014441.1/.p1  ORF type:complete len:623 (+),score=47.40 gb/GECG01014441.1/:1-1869(+)
MWSSTVAGQNFMTRKKSQQRTMRAGLYFLHFLNYATFSFVAPFLPQVASKRGLTLLEIGLVMASFGIAAFLAELVVAQLLKCISPKYVVVGGLFAMTIVTALFAGVDLIYNHFGDFFTALLVLRALQGVASRMAERSAVLAVAAMLEKEGSLTTVVFAVHLASALGVMIGPPYGGVFYQWAGAFILPSITIACLYAVLTFALAWALPRVPSTANNPIIDDQFTAFDDPYEDNNYRGVEDAERKNSAEQSQGGISLQAFPLGSQKRASSINTTETKHHPERSTFQPNTTENVKRVRFDSSKINSLHEKLLRESIENMGSLGQVSTKAQEGEADENRRRIHSNAGSQDNDRKSSSREHPHADVSTAFYNLSNDGLFITSSKVIGAPGVVVSLLITSICFFSVTSLHPIVSPHLSKFGLQPALIGLLFGLAFAACMLGALVSASLVQHMRHYWVLFGLGGLTIGWSILAPIFQWMKLTLVLQMISLATIGGGFGLAFPASLRTMIRNTKQLGRGALEVVCKWISLFSSLGITVGPLFAAYVVDKKGFTGVCVCVCYVTIAMNGIFLGSILWMKAKRFRRGQSRPTEKSKHQSRSPTRRDTNSAMASGTTSENNTADATRIIAVNI